MKKYKMLVPIVLIGFTALSVYQLFSQNLSTYLEYNNYLSNARYCAGVGIVDAAEYFEQALSIKKDIDVYEEYANYYLKIKDYDSAVAVANTMVEAYPKSSKGYDLLMSIYNGNHAYNQLFDVYSKAQRKNIHSASIDEAYRENEYEYYSNGKSYLNIKPELNGYYAVQNEKGNWGYVDERGSLVVGCQYRYAGGFSNQLASVKTKDDELFYINPSGGKKFVFDTDQPYDYLGQIVDGIYAVGDNATYAYYDQSFQKKFGDYQYAGTFNCGAAAVESDGKWMLIDTSGKAISDTYDRILMDENDIACVNNRAIAEKGGVYFILNEKGEVVKKTDYQSIFYIKSGDLIAYESKDKWGFCDRDGNPVIEPRFDEARSFSNGFAAVCKADKWGYIIENGELVIDYTFDAAYDFNASGCVFVSTENQRWEMIKLYKDNYK